MADYEKGDVDMSEKVSVGELIETKMGNTGVLEDRLLMCYAFMHIANHTNGMMWLYNPNPKKFVKGYLFPVDLYGIVYGKRLTRFPNSFEKFRRDFERYGGSSIRGQIDIIGCSGELITAELSMFTEKLVSLKEVPHIMTTRFLGEYVEDDVNKLYEQWKVAFNRARAEAGKS